MVLMYATPEEILEEISLATVVILHQHLWLVLLGKFIGNYNDAQLHECYNYS